MTTNPLSSIIILGNYKIITNNNNKYIISDALYELKHSASHVLLNVTKNGRPLPLFFVNFKPNTNDKEVLSQSSMLDTKIKAELPYRTKSDPPQCKNCQT